MSLRLAGLGWVTPLGSDLAGVWEKLCSGAEAEPTTVSSSLGRKKAYPVFAVPPAAIAEAARYPRLRRASAISRFAVVAGLAALRDAGIELEEASAARTALVFAISNGGVIYTKRFYHEIVQSGAAAASPLLFPETVFNAPASHISAYLGSSAINYTLVGDEGTFLLGLATGANWLAEGKVEACVVVASEEADWLTAEAMGLFDRSKIASEGAGALILTPQKTEVELLRITDEFLYAKDGKTAALERMKKELGEPGGETALYDSTSGERGISKEENRLWKDWKWPRIAPRRVLGEGLMAATAWQCVAAADHIAHGGCGEAFISCAGFHQHAIGAILGRAG